MSDDLFKTIKIQRDSKVGTDSRGRTVWTKPIETVELELVSTQMLEQILETEDAAQQEKIRALASSEDGVLARTTDSNEFDIVKDDELEAALQEANATAKARHSPVEFTLERISETGEHEELSLVTTQALRRILATDDGKDPDEPDLDVDDGGGYNPYNSG